MKHRKAAVEYLAQQLHEAGRAAVEAGQTVAAERFGDYARVFVKWEEISEQAREGRRVQARYLLEHFNISKKPRVAAVTEADVAKQ